jgi:hypothetical protein
MASSGKRPYIRKAPDDGLLELREPLRAHIGPVYPIQANHVGGADERVTMRNKVTKASERHEPRLGRAFAARKLRLEIFEYLGSAERKGAGRRGSYTRIAGALLGYQQ